MKDVFESIFGVSLTEISYVDGVTSSIQTQLNSKVNKNGETMTGSLLINNSTDSDSDTDDSVKLDSLSWNTNSCYNK